MDEQREVLAQSIEETRKSQEEEAEEATGAKAGQSSQSINVNQPPSLGPCVTTQAMFDALLFIASDGISETDAGSLSSWVSPVHAAFSDRQQSLILGTPSALSRLFSPRLP